MSKLQELKSLVSSMFEHSENKSDIENLAKANKYIEEAEAEAKALNDKHLELLKDYKEVVKHTSFKPDSNVDTNPMSSAPDFDAMLNEYMSKK